MLHREGKEVSRRVVEAQLSLLLNVGLLTRHTASRDRYLFAMPNAGPLVRAIIAGRKVTPHCIHIVVPVIAMHALRVCAAFIWSGLISSSCGVSTYEIVQCQAPALGTPTLHLRMHIPCILSSCKHG